MWKGKKMYYTVEKKWIVKIQKLMVVGVQSNYIQHLQYGTTVYPVSSQGAWTGLHRIQQLLFN